MGIHIESANDALREKIVTYFGYVEEQFLKGISKTCAKMIIEDQFNEICSNRFEMPAFKEMETVVFEELKRNFDKKVIHIVEQTYPDMSDDELDHEIEKLEERYYHDHEAQINAAVAAALKELKQRVDGLKKEINAIKRKYTT